MARWMDALKKTRDVFRGRLSRLLGGEPGAEADLDELEALLIRADVAPRLTLEWIGRIERNARATPSQKRALLRAAMIETLGETTPFTWNDPANPPLVVLLVGINGAGKTTTCAKLALHAAEQGRRPLLAATDTFRAAGADQLRVWAERVGTDIVAGKQGSDAAAVAFDAVEAARARKAGVLLVDTAGRMHTRTPLMNELKKVSRATAKSHPGAPHETWIVLDAAMGQNAVAQARVFHETTPLTGAVITKLDGSSKGGFIFSIRRELDIPILFAGLGEGERDLAVFQAGDFVSALLGDEEEPS